MTTGSNGDDPYGPCVDDADCPMEGSHCAQILEDFSVCAPPCEGDDCPYEVMTSAMPLCTQVANGAEGCVLLCQEGDVCPEGMVCVPVDVMNPGGLGACGWG